MRNPFEALVEPLDPEEQAMVDEVCGALADPWGVTVGQLGPRFKYALLQAARKGPPEIRKRIFDLVEEGVTTDRTIIIAAGQYGGKNGYIYPWSQINEYGGWTGSEPDPETGELRRVLRFPTGERERRSAA